MNILFLCTHNSARSILAEAVLNHIGGTRFKGYSAGSRPRENQKPHPLALETLAEAGIVALNLYSKSWDEFAQAEAPSMDLIITVCDSAAGEICPIWPGAPATAHWGYPDPSAKEGDETIRREAFRQTLHDICERLEIFIGMIKDQHDREHIQNIARNLGKERS